MDSTKPKPFVFVLMPFTPEFDDVYKLGIKPACEKAGAYAERVDEQLFSESILNRIFNQISKADVIVSDMTGRNPNVFYETGYAHALGKKVILLTENSEDIPFDLKHYPHIIYKGRIADLATDLERRVNWAIQQPDDVIIQGGLQVLIDGYLLPWEEIPLKFSNWFELPIDIHNSTESLIKTVKFKFGFLLEDPDIEVLGDWDSFKQPDGPALFVRKTTSTLYPGSWKSFEVRFHLNKIIAKGVFFSSTIRLFTQEGVSDFPFSVTAIQEGE
jgi:hypothetical protein